MRPLLVFVAILGVAGCLPGRSQPDLAAEESAIRAANAAWAKTADPLDVDQMMSFFTDDAIVLSPDAPIAVGKAAIRSSLPPGFTAKWDATKIEVARSGEMAYTIGSSEVTVKDANGAPITRKGKWLGIWKKQPDGSWKCAVDMPNFDRPAALPSP